MLLTKKANNDMLFKQSKSFKTVLQKIAEDFKENMK